MEAGHDQERIGEDSGGVITDARRQFHSNVGFRVTPSRLALSHRRPPRSRSTLGGATSHAGRTVKSPRFAVGQYSSIVST
jgi:hypothetical protein